MTVRRQYLTACFNPCCIGLSAEAGYSFKARSHDPGFNPCCIGLSAEAGRMAKANNPATWCFNPCCIGLSAEATDAVDQAGGAVPVSILVVLD